MSERKSTNQTRPGHREHGHHDHHHHGNGQAGAGSEEPRIGHGSHAVQVESAGEVDGHEHHHGHGDHAGGDHSGHDHAAHDPDIFRRRFWISLILTVPILYFTPLIQNLLGYSAVHFPGVQWVSPILGIAIYVYGGRVFLEGAAHELRARQPGMMALISLAITVAFVYSLAVTLGLPGETLYWELATLVTIMLLGHWIEMAAVQGASRALEHLAELVPNEAHKLEGHQVVDVPVDQLRAGDRILIRPGEQIPVDGTVEEGVSSVNEAFLTGESRPVPKNSGSEVVAGSVNGEGALTVSVSRTGDDTTLSQIRRLVQEAQASRSRFQNLADRAAAWLTYVAIGAGVVTFVAWMLSLGDVQFALTRTVAVLVVACPHALGLAIPLVTVNATAMSARAGILVRNREAFERARDIRVAAFDKTGTLTQGNHVLRRIYASEDVGEDEVLRLAAALESLSEHHLSRAVIKAARERNLQWPPVADFAYAAGKGITGVVDGTKYYVGRPDWMDEQQLRIPETLQAGLDEAETRGESAVALWNEERVLALLTLADQVRDSARRAVQQLQTAGVEVVMITGDAEAVARTVSAELGIQRFHARVLPQDKAEIIRELRSTGPVAFVGDGINDAPALLEADLGVAIGAGTDVAIESADLVLIENDPLDVVGALRLSNATYRKMIQNLFWATGYNVVALPLAGGIAASWSVLLSPAVGAGLMSLSTVVVAVNAMLLRRVQIASS